MKRLIIALIILGFGCSSELKEKENIDKEALNFLMKNLKWYVENSNEEFNDSVDIDILILDEKVIRNDGFEIVLLETVTKDKRLYQSIFGIIDTSYSNFPNFVFSNDLEQKFTIDKVVNSSDSIHLIGIMEDTESISEYGLSFDKKFNGKSFPWKSSRTIIKQK